MSHKPYLHFKVPAKLENFDETIRKKYRKDQATAPVLGKSDGKRKRGFFRNLFSLKCLALRR